MESGLPLCGSRPPDEVGILPQRACLARECPAIPDRDQVGVDGVVPGIPAGSCDLPGLVLELQRDVALEDGKLTPV
jgi:hypothetical protein